MKQEIISPSDDGGQAGRARQFDEVAQALARARTVCVCAHVDPDGDALGSTLAVTALVRSMWPDKLVTPLFANEHASLTPFEYLPGAGDLMYAGAYDATPDLFVAVDTPNAERLGAGAQVLARAGDSCAFDHHVTMVPFARTSILDDSAAAAGEIVWDFARHVGFVPTSDFATCILTAVITDTGRFQYQNTDAHALETAAAMVRAGASPSKIAERVYQSDSIQAMHLKALAMQRLTIDETGTVAYSYVTERDLAQVGAKPADCESLIDVVRCVGTVRACVFLREKSDGVVRCNLRAKVDGLNVSRVAEAFGGGGHVAAAGLTYVGSMQDATRDVVAALATAALALDGTRGAADGQA